MKDSCRVHRETMSALLDGAASAAETAAMEAHRATCAECRTALDELRWTTGQVRKLEPVEPPPWMTARIMARVRSETAPAPSLWRRLFVPIVASPQFRVASLALVGAAGYYIVTRSPGMLKETAEAPRAAEAPAVRQPLPAAAPAPEPPPFQKPDFAPAPPPATAAMEKRKGSAPPRVERRTEADHPMADALPAEPPPMQAAEASGKAAPAPESKAAGPARAESRASVETGLAGATMAGNLAASSAAAPAPPPRAAKQAAPSAGGETVLRDTAKKERAASAKGNSLIVTVVPSDPAAFLPFLERELARLGAEIASTPGEASARSLTARLDSRRLPELLDRLSRAGTVREGPESGASLPPVITVTIRW